MHTTYDHTETCHHEFGAGTIVVDWKNNLKQLDANDLSCFIEINNIHKTCSTHNYFVTDGGDTFYNGSHCL